MFWPFRRKSTLDPETATWHADNMAWLIAQFGGHETLTEATLVLPRPGFFTFDGEQGHALALRIFGQVKTYCGMSDWPIDLVPDDNPLAEPAVLSMGMVVPTKHAAGTFSWAGNRIQITYAAAQVRRPDRLIATFAHELAHCLLAMATTPPPCEDDEIEFLTDLGAVYLGFGVFLANARFEFEALSDGPMQGWRWQRAGYLPEADLIFALALFMRAKRLETASACEALKPHLAKLLRRTLRELPDESPYVAQVGAAMVSQLAPD